MNEAARQYGELCRQLDRKVHELDAMERARARAEVDYKSGKARRILIAQAEGARSVAQAEIIATADEHVADLHLEHLTADGVMSAARQMVAALRTRIDFGRSVVSLEKAADQLSNVPR